MDTATSVTISSFYVFTDLGAAGARDVGAAIEARAEERGVRGLFILAPEGCNATFSGSAEDVGALEELCREKLSSNIFFKRSRADAHPFRKIAIKLRDEIVTSGRPDVSVEHGARTLTPSEWHERLKQGNVKVLDTRNHYEIEIGKFTSAIDLSIQTFSDFEAAVKNRHFNSSEPILMYCTGGVRCEKALPILEGLGFTNVFQLEGGILNYLEQFPDGFYEGECFVFDDRVALDRFLQPTSTYVFCPNCGNPAKEAVTCVTCGTTAKVCPQCTLANDRYCSLECRARGRSENVSHE